MTEIIKPDYSENYAFNKKTIIARFDLPLTVRTKKIALILPNKDNYLFNEIISKTSNISYCVAKSSQDKINFNEILSTTSNIPYNATKSLSFINKMLISFKDNLYLFSQLNKKIKYTNNKIVIPILNYYGYENVSYINISLHFKNYNRDIIDAIYENMYLQITEKSQQHNNIVSFRDYVFNLELCNFHKNIKYIYFNYTYDHFKEIQKSDGCWMRKVKDNAMDIWNYEEMFLNLTNNTTNFTLEIKENNKGAQILIKRDDDALCDEKFIIKLYYFYKKFRNGDSKFGEPILFYENKIDI